MFSHVYLCLHLCKYVSHYLLMLIYVYSCLSVDSCNLMFTRYYLPIITHVFSCLPMFTGVYLCLKLFTCACLPKFTLVFPCLPMFTLVHPCLLVFA